MTPFVLFFGGLVIAISCGDSGVVGTRLFVVGLILVIAGLLL